MAYRRFDELTLSIATIAAVTSLALALALTFAFLSLLEGVLAFLNLDAALVLAVTAVVSTVRAVRVIALG